MDVNQVERAVAGGNGRLAAVTFEDFVSHRSQALMRTAWLLTGNRADAEDLLQVSLVKLYVGWRRASSARSVEAYAHRVLVNAFVSGRRPVRWRRERLVATLPEALPGTSTQDPQVEDRLTLWPHVTALPPRQRAVMVLRYYDDRSEAEIAEILGCARGTVKSTASAALKTPREKMGEVR